MGRTYVDGMAISKDPDQTAPFGSSLIWVYTECLDLSVSIDTIVMVRSLVLMSQYHD